MRHLASLLLLGLLPASALAAQPMELKGLSVGITEAELLERAPFMSCEPAAAGKGYDRICAVDDGIPAEFATFAGMKTGAWGATLRNDKVVNVILVLPSAGVDRPKTALDGKFGPGKPGGALTVLWMWEDEGTRLTLGASYEGDARLMLIDRKAFRHVVNARRSEIEAEKAEQRSREQADM
jgi:hypothetical protein